MTFDAAAYASIKAQLKSVNLVAVTKQATPNDIVAAYHAGIRDFGENRVQDALVRMDAVKALLGDRAYHDIRWHFIGTLQRNKVRVVLGRFQMIQSIDSVVLAQAIARHQRGAPGAGRMRVLIQVNISGEEQKHGLRPDDSESIAGICRLLDVRGIMGIASEAHPERAFALAQDMFRRARARGCDWSVLSLGMSDDWRIALRYGATMVRIGSALFGKP
ncbi:YggS family pyridoxal phosphate-dependent enzyme [Candidatus Woesearchaeota archaeon CG_4_10_14_0_2_um_filter_57_5]|nr:MAG: YggS family pyridoxal phosphate-dependent enzyme [Candidatus Woesearchaeota archaeon CG_4_10_14_0_2_um_filter_57_5]